MKILSVYPGYLDRHRGTPIRARNILSQLSKNYDIDLTVCSHDLTVPLAGVKTFTLQPKRWQNIFLIYKKTKELNPDVVIGHTIMSYIYLTVVKLFVNKKISLEMHGFIEEELFLNHQIRLFKYIYLKFLFGMFYKLCDLITTCSPSATKKIKAHNKNTHTIFGGSDLKLFNKDVKPEYNFSDSDEDIVIGYAGNSRTWQGLDFLLETFKELHAHNKNFKLAILLSDSTAVVDQPGVKVVPSVKYTKVPGFLASCDILIIPRPRNQVNELSFPSKLLEYLAMGKSVIASSTSDTFEVVQNNINGVLYTPGNQDELLLVFESLRNSDLRDELGEQAYRTIVTNLTWEKQVDLYYKYLTQI